MNHVAAAYCPIVSKHMNDEVTPEEKQWQQVRFVWRHVEGCYTPIWPAIPVFRMSG